MANAKRPEYLRPKSGDFFAKLRQEVQETVLTDQRLQFRTIWKTAILLGVYCTSYAGILLFGHQTLLLFFFYMCTGFAMITLFINSFHDAVHGSLFKKPKHNAWFTSILALFGSNTWLWTKRHIGLHHAYPNVQNWDVDIKQGSIVHIFPGSPLLGFHKYQHFYMWLIYPLYSLNWIFIRDFRDVFGSSDNYIKRISDIPRAEVYKLFAAKILNLFHLVCIPILVLEQPWYIIVSGWLVMHVSGSTLGVIALISTHVDENATFSDPIDGRLGMSWAEHQLRATKDFSTDSRVANFLFGGFTHHVAHHLFPGVAHTYYPKITPIIKRHAEENNLPYTSYPFHEAIRSHFRLLKKNGHENIFVSGDL
jgi:linoleoyl-CoA desaturase